MIKKKILIPYVEVGSCHTSTAQAIRESIEKLYPGKYQIDLIDFIKEVGEIKKDKAHKEQWKFLLAHPYLARWGYILIHSIFRPIAKNNLLFFMNKFLKKGIKYIDKYKPDIIFSTYHTTAELAAIAKGKLKSDFKVIGFNPDPFTAHLWIGKKKVDYWVVSSEQAQKKSVKQGLNKQQTKICPFPIRSDFFNTVPKKELIKKYNIDENKYIILASAGGEGISNVVDYIKEMYIKELPFNIIAVNGKNENSKKELEELKKKYKSKTNLISLGFVNNMNELISMCDFTITRAGSSSTFESLLMKKPIVFTQWTTYNDKPNVNYVLKNKLGWYTPNRKKFFKVIDVILNTNILEEYVKNIKELNLRSGADEIARFIVQNIPSDN